MSDTKKPLDIAPTDSGEGVSNGLACVARRDLEPYKALVLLLERAGWETHEISINKETRRVRMIFESFKGRQVMFDSDASGRASTEREQREVNTVSVGRRGDRFPAQCLSYRFLGREKHADPLTGLRWLAEYLCANGTRELPAGVLAKALGDGFEGRATDSHGTVTT